MSDAELDQLQMLLKKIDAAHMLQAAPPEDVLDGRRQRLMVERET